MNELTMRRLIIGGVLLLPVVLVKVTALMSGGPAPAASSAATIAAVTDPAALVIKQKSANEAQLAALEHIQWLEDQSYGEAPLHYKGPISRPVWPEEMEHLVLNAILVTRGVETAVINGQLYRRGDPIEGTSWRVAEIDNTTMQVTVKRSGRDEGRGRVISLQD